MRKRTCLPIRVQRSLRCRTAAQGVLERLDRAQRTLPLRVMEERSGVDELNNSVYNMMYRDR
jgi:hypothetical protein